MRLRDRFRCEHCRDLLEIIYPGWEERGPAGPMRRLEAALAGSADFVRAGDQSGVWRFREILPEISQQQVITFREGNTPLYAMPHCAKSAGMSSFSPNIKA